MRWRPTFTRWVAHIHTLGGPHHKLGGQAHSYVRRPTFILQVVHIIRQAVHAHLYVKRPTMPHIIIKLLLLNRNYETPNKTGCLKGAHSD